MSRAERIALLINRLTAIGFTLSEIQRLRRIEGTLRRWSEAECNGEIQRDEVDGKTRRVYSCYLPNAIPGSGRIATVIPDRETSALKRLEAIVFARNARARGVDETLTANPFMQTPDDRDVIAYHQTDPRGAALYLLTRAQLKTDSNQIVEKAKSWGVNFLTTQPKSVTVRSQDGKLAIPGLWETEEIAARAYLEHRGASIPARDMLPIDQYYNRGVAVY